MKSDKKVISLFVAILICGIVSSCGIANYTKTMPQPSAQALAIKAVTEFKVKPIDFSAIKPEDLGYANAEEWKADLEPVPRAFAEAFPILFKEVKMGEIPDYATELAKEQKMADKKVIMVKKDEPVTAGIVVEVLVKQIILKWNYFSGRPDEFVCNVTFTDAATGKKLFSDVININSSQPQLYVGGNRGLAAVGPGLSFSGRLQAASNNTAWVLVKIMINGSNYWAYN